MQMFAKTGEIRPLLIKIEVKLDIKKRCFFVPSRYRWTNLTSDILRRIFRSGVNGLQLTISV